MTKPYWVWRKHELLNFSVICFKDYIVFKSIYYAFAHQTPLFIDEQNKTKLKVYSPKLINSESLVTQNAK